jgi:hypothetical protein
MVEYAKKHGYSFCGWPDRYHTDEQRDPSFLTYGDRAKLQIYKDLYADFDVIVWLDVDTLITNQDKRIEDILGDRPFLWTVDWHGPLSGFTIARCIPSVHLALNTVLHRAAEDAWSLGTTGKPLAHGGRSDQDTMRFFAPWRPFNEIFGPQNQVTCKEAGHCMPMAYMKADPLYFYIANWEPGDFLWTLPGAPVAERVALLFEKAVEVYGDTRHEANARYSLGN